VLPAREDSTLAPTAVRIAAGHASTSALGPMFGAVTRRKGLIAMFDTLQQAGNAALGPTLWLVLWSLVKIVAVVLPLLLCVAYLTLWERKAIGWSQVRPGPNRVGPYGLLTPIADAVKLIFKEIIRPDRGQQGPVLPGARDDHHAGAGGLGRGALRARSGAGQRQRRAAVPDGHHLAGGLRRDHRRLGQQLQVRLPGRAARFGPDGQLRDRHGLLPGGGADGAGSMNLSEIVASQGRGSFADMGVGVLSWNWLPLLPIFVVFFISGLAETNRHPFDVVEGESEIVAGHMIEYSGMSFAMFFLAEYANMILVSMMTTLLFLGGWLPPVAFLDFIPGWIWLAASRSLSWPPCSCGCAPPSRAYRYDQIMRLGWKIFIPMTLVWLVVVGLWIQSPFNIWK
jgi:NADH-quinone oxidoreductase subunit H